MPTLNRPDPLLNDEVGDAVEKVQGAVEDVTAFLGKLGYDVTPNVSQGSRESVQGSSGDSSGTPFTPSLLSDPVGWAVKNPGKTALGLVGLALGVKVASGK